MRFCKKRMLVCIFLIVFMGLFNNVDAESAYGSPIKKEQYEISRSFVNRELTQGNIFKDSFEIKNLGDRQLKVSYLLTESISSIIALESSGEIIGARNYTIVYFTLIGKENGNYAGEIKISGDIDEKIPVNVTVINESLDPQFFVEVSTYKKKLTFNDKIDFKLDIKKIAGETEIKNVTFAYYLKNPSDNSSYFLGNETKDIAGSLQMRKNFNFPEELAEGYYVLETLTTYNNKVTSSSDEFLLTTSFWSIRIFGFIPLWMLATFLAIIFLGILSFSIIRKEIEKKKKYKMQLYTNTLPKKSENTLALGKIAETNIPAYLEMDALTTHCVVAGATGGGKSIAAQVIIEETLLKNIAVIVFDPTAQWSGMLRKCDDKKMFSFYPKFGLKPSDARAFPGNVRQITNERQAIDIKKYMNPGQMQIFTMNKLTPPQIDTFVASVIASIFKSDPKEYPGLKVMLVFDEVHRLLPKFGGSGKGFLQIERACREFRKWGFGVMLVSQVLSDFVGEIKANINTEAQMRTRDEADLNRIKTKYGEEFLQSLIKASVGVGMFVNPRYNKGKPYFINFRPILHNTRRLSDEILEQYNKYGEIIDDLEYQIEQLEQEKIDVFDLKMELKLVKDKLMTGNFTVVDIYLEGLKPRVEKHWQQLNKKPKKREIDLVDTTIIESSLKQAQKGREEFSKQETKQNSSQEKEEIKEAERIEPEVSGKKSEEIVKASSKEEKDSNENNLKVKKITKVKKKNKK